MANLWLSSVVGIICISLTSFQSADAIGDFFPSSQWFTQSAASSQAQYVNMNWKFPPSLPWIYQQAAPQFVPVPPNVPDMRAYLNSYIQKTASERLGGLHIPGPDGCYFEIVDVKNAGNNAWQASGMFNHL